MYFQNGFCPIAFCHLNIDFPNGCLICIQTLEFSFFCNLRYKNHFVLRIFVNGTAYQISQMDSFSFVLFSFCHSSWSFFVKIMDSHLRIRETI